MPIKTPFYPLLGLVSVILMTAVSCSGPVTKDHVKPLPIERLDLAVSGDSWGNEGADTTAFDLYLAVLSADSLDRATAIAGVRDSKMMKVFGPDVIRRLGSLDSVEAGLGILKSRIDDGLLPDISLSRVYGIITPYRQSVIVSDSIVLVSLNHYLGADYPGYDGLPQYQRANKIKSQIPHDIAEALVRVNYPYIPVSGTLIERMLYEGAVIEAISSLTGLADYGSMGMTPAEYALFKDNETQMWQYLAANDMLYSTAQADISRIVDPAPYTAGFPVPVPGQAGCYLGHNIIKQYLKQNPDVSISTMLQTDFYSRPQEILLSSGYSPVKH